MYIVYIYFTNYYRELVCTVCVLISIVEFETLNEIIHDMIRGLRNLSQVRTCHTTVFSIYKFVTCRT